MEDLHNDSVKRNNFEFPSVGCRETRTQLSITSSIIPDQKTVMNVQYSRISQSENNLNSPSCIDDYDVNLTKLLKVMTIQNNKTKPIQSNSPTIDIELPSHDSSSNDIETRQDIQNIKYKYFESLKPALDKMHSMNSHERIVNLDYVYKIMKRAWAIPDYGHTIGYSLCKYLRLSGGLVMLIEGCRESDESIQFSSARVLEQCLIRENTKHVIEHGLEQVVKVAVAYAKSTNTKHSRVGTGIIEHLFKYSEGICNEVIGLGGLDAVLFDCRIPDLETLRNCARSLANLSLFGGAENQEAMIVKKVHMWLFPLAFHDDDNIKYYACLAIAVLVANKEIEIEVLKSGTLDLVEPFVTSQDPSKFAQSNLANVDGQGKEWLKRLVPVLSSNREEASNLAAFHFCMEADIKKKQRNIELFREIGAIEPLKIVASCPNAIASKFAARTLRLIGETVPHKLSQQVPLWSVGDVQEWIKQIGFGAFEQQFVESQVDGDILLQLNEKNLQEDIGISNGILRMRFARELQHLKKIADYSSKNCAKIYEFLNKIGPEYCVYTYDIYNAGIGKFPLEQLNENILITECGISNSTHRYTILDAAKSLNKCLSNELETNMDKTLDVFVSYRRSSGSQLASLLKVHLQLRGFSVFIDVERLEGGKFDSGLLNSIRQAKYFILILTSNALERCIDDYDGKDWVHREIVAALNSNCTIIPIEDNFIWPDIEKLPEDIRSICYFNRVTWIHDYQDACIDKLERFMSGETKTDLIPFEKNNIIYSDYDSYNLSQTNLIERVKLSRSLKRKTVSIDCMNMGFGDLGELKRPHSLDIRGSVPCQSLVPMSANKQRNDTWLHVGPSSLYNSQTNMQNEEEQMIDGNVDVSQKYKSQSLNPLPNEFPLVVPNISEVTESMRDLPTHGNVQLKNESLFILSSESSQSCTAECSTNLNVSDKSEIEVKLQKSVYKRIVYSLKKSLKKVKT